jgi:hypothetical protein
MRSDHLETSPSVREGLEERSVEERLARARLEEHAA